MKGQVCPEPSVISCNSGRVRHAYSSELAQAQDIYHGANCYWMKTSSPSMWARGSTKTDAKAIQSYTYPVSGATLVAGSKFV